MSVRRQWSQHPGTIGKEQCVAHIEENVAEFCHRSILNNSCVRRCEPAFYRNEKPKDPSKPWANQLKAAEDRKLSVETPTSTSINVFILCIIAALRRYPHSSGCDVRPPT